MSGNSILIAGAAAGLFAPVATFGFGLPLWVSLPGAGLIFAGLTLILGPRRLFEGFQFGAADQASVDLARDILTGAHADLNRLEGIVAALRESEARGRLRRLYEIVLKVVGEVESEPRRVNAARRLLTYYLPSAVRIGEGYRTLEASLAPDPKRLAAAEAMLAKLDEVFVQHADRLSQEEIEGLDLEIKLLEDSIREERRR